MTHKQRLLEALKSHGTWATKKEIEKWIILNDWQGNVDTYFRRARELCADGLIERKDSKYDEYRYVGLELNTPQKSEEKQNNTQDALLKVDFPRNNW